LPRGLLLSFPMTTVKIVRQSSASLARSRLTNDLSRDFTRRCAARHGFESGSRCRHCFNVVSAGDVDVDDVDDGRKKYERRNIRMKDGVDGCERCVNRLQER
jgi:hypothetical protein